MRDYIASVQHHQTADFQRVAHNLHECGAYLVFRHYMTENVAKLVAARTCKQHILCPFCAIRRGAKMLARYTDRFQIVQADNSHLVPWMVTLTVKNGDSLAERYAHLHKSVKYLNKLKHLNRGHEICKAQGTVFSYEFKRGEGSGQWHPHMHGVWLCSSPLDVKKLSDEWLAITGDSFIVEAHPLYGDQVDAFCEVFKYAVKFAGLPLADNLHAFETLRGKRLVRSTGLLWGVDMPDEDLLDEEMDDAVWVDIAYRYFHDSDTYRPCERSTSSEYTSNEKHLKRPRGPAPTPPQEHLTLGQAHLRHLQRKYPVEPAPKG